MRKPLQISLIILFVIAATGCTSARTLVAMQQPTAAAPIASPTALPVPATAVPTLPAPTTIPTQPPTITTAPESTLAAGENQTPGLSTGDLAAVVGLAADLNLELRKIPATDSPVVAAIPPSTTGLTISEPAEQGEGITWLPVVFEDKTSWADSAYLAKQYGRPPEGLVEASLAAIQAIKNQDFLTLATMVGSVGLRFSPYGYIRDGDQTFTAEQVRTIQAVSRIFHWGVYDGSGEPIDLSFPAYYEKFIYDVDFAQPQAIGFNTTIGTGNTINNLTEFYPGADFVEYHFYGFDPQYGGMDWRSLRLVFQPSADGYKLVGIVHDQWTV